MRKDEVQKVRDDVWRTLVITAASMLPTDEFVAIMKAINTKGKTQVGKRIRGFQEATINIAMALEEAKQRRVKKRA